MLDFESKVIAFRKRYCVAPNVVYLGQTEYATLINMCKENGSNLTMPANEVYGMRLVVVADEQSCFRVDRE
jgi:hypothetical protein